MSDAPVKSLNLPVGPPPVGLLMTSILTWDELKTHFPGFEEFWHPADGSKVPEECTLSKVLALRGEGATTHLPDLRNKILRGRSDFQILPPEKASTEIVIADSGEEQAATVYFYIRIN